MTTPPTMPQASEFLNWNDVDRLIDYFDTAVARAIRRLDDDHTRRHRARRVDRRGARHPLHPDRGGRVFRRDAEPAGLANLPAISRATPCSRDRRVLVVDDIWSHGRTVTTVKGRVQAAGGRARDGSAPLQAGQPAFSASQRPRLLRGDHRPVHRLSVGSAARPRPRRIPVSLNQTNHRRPTVTIADTLHDADKTVTDERATAPSMGGGHSMWHDLAAARRLGRGRAGHPGRLAAARAARPAASATWRRAPTAPTSMRSASPRRIAPTIRPSGRAAAKRCAAMRSTGARTAARPGSRSPTICRRPRSPPSTPSSKALDAALQGGLRQSTDRGATRRRISLGRDDHLGHPPHRLPARTGAPSFSGRVHRPIRRLPATRIGAETAGALGPASRYRAAPSPT